MSEEAKVRLMVIPIVAMLAITMVVAGWQQSEEQEIEVNEGYDEIEVKVPPHPGALLIENSTTASSYLNNENNSFELSVEFGMWKAGSEDYSVDMFVSVKSTLQPSFEPETLKIKARTLNAPNITRNHMNFLRSYGETENLTRWHPSEIIPGVAGEGYCFDGFDIEQRDFQANNIKIGNEYRFSEEDKTLESSITLEITAVMRGLSKDVTATVDVTFTQEEIK